MASKIDQFWEIFKAVSGDTSADVTTSTNAIAKSDRTKVESYFSNTIDQYTFSTTDYNRLRKFMIDLFASFRTQSTISLSSTDPHSLTNSDLDELFRSMGYNLSPSLRGFDENPLEQKVQFFLDLVNLYKVKGTPQSLVDVLQYYGVTEVDIYEFFLKKSSPTRLFFEGKAVAGTSINPSDISLLYANLTSADPHWLYTSQQILQLDQINKINLPSKTPYLGIRPTVDLEGAEISIIERYVQDQYSYYISHGVLPPATAEITYIGETRTLLELYLSCIYMFNTLFDCGSDLTARFSCYDGTSTDNSVIIDEFKVLTQSKVETRSQLKTRYNTYLDLFSRPKAENFLVDENSAGNILNTIAPDIKTALDSAEDPLEVLYSLLKDLALWVRATIGFGFVNFGFILFGLQEFFKDLKPVIDFFKPYRARLLLLELLQVKNRLFNTIVIEDSLSNDINLNFHDFMTGDSKACCQPDDSTCTNSISVCRRDFIGSLPSSYNWKDNWAVTTDYSVNDVVSSGSLSNQYICIQAHTSGIQTKPGTGLDWTLYWQLISTIECTDIDTTNVSYYSRDTFDCGSSFDIGAVTDIDQDINIEITDEIYDYLRCPRSGEPCSNETYVENIYSGADSVAIEFKTEQPSLNYNIGLSVSFNPINPLETPNQFATLVTNKTTTGFTVNLSSPVPSDNYYIDWFISDSTNFSSVQIADGTSSFIVNLQTPYLSSDYKIFGSLVNDIDTLSSIYAFTISEKTPSSFKVILSGDTDSPNYKFDYLITDSTESGISSVALGSSTISVTYPTPLDNSSYALLATLESNSINVYAWTITEKTEYGFTAEISDPIDSTNNISWVVIPSLCIPAGFVVSEIVTLEYNNPYTTQIENGDDSVIIGFDTAQPNSNYGLGISVRLDPTSDPSEIPNQFATLVTNKTTTGFVVNLSSPVPSDNYYIDWFVSDSTEVSSIQIADGTSSFIVNIQTPCSNPDYTISGVITNNIDTTSSIYAFTISEKTPSSFKVTLSGDTDSPNYKFDYFVCEGPLRGVQPIIPGNSTVSVIYPTPLLRIEHPLITVVESNSPNVYTWTITEKTLTGFTVELSDLSDSTNCNLLWTIPETQYHGLSEFQYYQSGGFRDFDSEGSFDCTHGFDLVQITIEDTITFLLEESGFFLLQENGFRLLL